MSKANNPGVSRNPELWLYDGDSATDPYLRSLDTAYAPEEGSVFVAQAAYDALSQQFAAVEAQRDQLLVERDGANERAGLLLKAKDEWVERARAAEEEAIQLRAAISDPESVFVNMKRGTIAKPSLRSMLDLYGEVVNGDEAQLLEIGKLRAEVEMLRSDRKACLEEFKALRRSADETESELRAEVEALRLLAGELYQVLGALDAPAGVLDAVLAAAHGESMGGRDSLLPFVSAEHEALREDAGRYRLLRRVTIEERDGSDAEFDAEFDFAIDAALAAKESA